MGSIKKERGMINFQREAKNLNKLKHKNIIRIKGFENIKYNNYIIIEYCNGGNLFDYKKFL